MVYTAIFVFKIIEDALATLRLIVVSNGKKVLGAILQFICTIIWVILSGSVLIDFFNDFGKVIAFALGALVGSYLGSFIEEKIALGTNLFVIKVKEENTSSLIYKFKRNNLICYKVFTSSGSVIIAIGKRKITKKIIAIINSVDSEALIFCEKIKLF